MRTMRDITVSPMSTDLNMVRCNSSMQLTRAADYAVRVMIYLATLPSGERASLPAIVEATSAPDSFLSKVLQGLTRARMITSRRGPAGGFEISAPGRLASIRDVVEAIDGPISLNVCLSQRRSCPRQSWCPAHPVWTRAQEALMGVLSTAMIADLASGGVDITTLTHIRTGTND
jgi:Rrf2 family protein